MAERWPSGERQAPRLRGRPRVPTLDYEQRRPVVAESIARGLHVREYSVIRVLDVALDLDDLDPEAFADLVNLRETRNLIAHNGGKVNQRFLHLVKKTVFEDREDRVIPPQEIGRFSSAVFWAAELTYRFAGGAGGLP